MKTQTTGLFDTHPADRDRIARARKEAAAGVFTLEGPATDVFRDFDALSRNVTSTLYRQMLGPQAGRAQLFPVSALVESQAAEKEVYEAHARYFLGALSSVQALPLPATFPAAPADPDEAERAVVNARADLEAARDENLALRRRWTALMEARSGALAALTLMKAGNRIKAADFQLDAPRPEAAEAAARGADARLAATASAMEPFGHAAAARLAAALAALGDDALCRRIPDGPALRDEARALYPCVVHLGGRVVAELPPLIGATGVLHRLLAVYQAGDNAANQDLINAVLRGAADLRDALTAFRTHLGDHILYPFEHARDDLPLGRYLLPDVPPKEDIGALLDASQGALNRVSQTYGRALGRLALTAEEVETLFGLDPIEVEPEPDAEA